MSRYSKAQLKHMATVVVTADKAGDARALRLYLALSAKLGLNPNDVRDRVKRLANG